MNKINPERYLKYPSGFYFDKICGKCAVKLIYKIPMFPEPMLHFPHIL